MDEQEEYEEQDDRLEHCWVREMRRRGEKATGAEMEERRWRSPNGDTRRGKASPSSEGKSVALSVNERCGPEASFASTGQHR